MNIVLKQLPAQVKNKLLPIYLIQGNVPLLIQEAKDILRDAAKQQGFMVRETLSMESGFDAEKFTTSTKNLDLFHEKRIIEINLATAKFNKQDTSIFVNYLNNPNPDILIILSADKLTSAQQKANWAKAIETTGCVVTIWPITANDLPAWITHTLKKFELTADHNSIKLLADFTEGNLLATKQAIERLALLYPKQLINTEKMTTAVIDNASYSIFDLTNYALQNAPRQVIRILTYLQQQQTESTLILWAITREIRNLINYKYELQRGSTIDRVLQHEWQSRRPLLKSALPRYSIEQLNASLQLASEIDQMIKGIKIGNVWNELLKLILNLCGLANAKNWH